MVKDQRDARARGYWLVAELSDKAGLTGARIRQLLKERRELKGDKAGQVWTIPYNEGLRWLASRQGGG